MIKKKNKKLQRKQLIDEYINKRELENINRKDDELNEKNVPKIIENSKRKPIFTYGSSYNTSNASFVTNCYIDYTIHYEKKNN